MLAACGGGSFSSAPAGVSITPVNIQGQYQVVGQSSLHPNSLVLVEANFTESGTNVSAGKPSVVLVQGAQSSILGTTLVGVGGECDNQIIGLDSIQGTFSSN